MDKISLLDAITRFYLESRDFNGMPVATLIENIKAPWDELRPNIETLVESELVGVLGAEGVNPHAVRIGFADTATQIGSLAESDLHHVCLYPRAKHLKTVVEPSVFAAEPYKRELALGAAQLSFRAFDLSILEYYRSDPRYYYQNDDVSGQICISDEFLPLVGMSESDKILLQTFGFAYDSDMNRSVAVFLRYLADLSPEHQSVWRAKELTGDYKLHPDYYRPTILGEWPERISLCRALILELQLINDMAIAAGRQPLFRTDCRDRRASVPRELCFLIRPTCKEFNNFVHVLDKLLSDNINRKFFGKEISFEVETTRNDGRIQVQQKGTLSALDEWVRMHLRTDDWSEWDESIATLREVRKLRQEPAHGLNDDKFDQKYIKEQRDLLVRVYYAVRTVRLILQLHPLVAASKIEIPEWLRDSKIWTL